MNKLRLSNGRFGTQPPLTRFWSKVRVTTPGCWEWKGAIGSKGYGGLRVGSRTNGSSRMIQAHRFAYETFVGPIPPGKEIDHLCRNRACVNPSHLGAVTHSENCRRGDTGIYAIRKGKQQTHCLRGHPLDNLNTYVDGRGKRSCKICRRDNLRKWRQKHETSRVSS